MAPQQGKVSGEKAKKEFMKSNLPTPVLGQIWMLADLDRDGRMTLQEFMIAMHLLSCKIKGIEVPRMLPASLRSSTDPSQQAFPLNNVPMGNSMPGGMNMSGNNMNMSANNMNMSGNNMMGMQSMQSPNMGMSGMNLGGMGRNPSMVGSPNFGGMGMGGGMNMNQNMMMQQPMMGVQSPMMGMQSSGMSPMQPSSMSPMQPMAMSSPMNSNMSHGVSGSFNASPGQINRVASLPTNTSAFGQQQPKPNNQSFTLPHSAKSNQSSVFSSNISGGVKPSPVQSNALDSLAIDGLSGFAPQQSSVSPNQQLAVGNISAPNRMKYTQMFKAADHEKTGFLAGEFQYTQIVTFFSLIFSLLSPFNVAGFYQILCFFYI